MGGGDCRTDAAAAVGACVARHVYIYCIIIIIMYISSPIVTMYSSRNHYL